MSQGKKIVQPPYLKAGDKVALISPAYWVPQEALQMAAEVIKGWGLQPVIGPHTNNLNVNAYAGTADERAADLLWALEDDTIKAVICSRGGYGSIHLLNRIPVECYQQHPKWLVGHGDITMLLYAIAFAGLMCIHGPMAFQIASAQEPATSIIRNIRYVHHVGLGYVQYCANENGDAPYTLAPAYVAWCEYCNDAESEPLASKDEGADIFLGNPQNFQPIIINSQTGAVHDNQSTDYSLAAAPMIIR